MQLILAIDSDPRQSEQLASLVRARLTVDLVQATSAGEGLHELKDRVPDLILTAPLLSPFDDGVLDEYLRDLGAAGAHVQTVRIPVLSAAPKKKALANRLFSLGRAKPTSAAAPDGCDPKAFVDEVAVYLSRAAEARQNMPRIAQAWSSRQEEASPSFVVASPVVVSPVVADQTMISEAVVEEFAEPLRDMESEPTYIEATTPILETMPVAERMTPAEPNRPVPGTSATFEAALAAIRAAWVKPAEPATAPSSTAAASTSRSASPGEVDLTNTIDALEDVGPRTTPPHVQVDKPHARPENGRDRQIDASGRRPMPDELDVFDADQCGFAALVDKLDEVADSKEAPTRKVAMPGGILFR